MADISRRDFIKAGVAGAALITYVTPTIETFMMSNAWADEGYESSHEKCSEDQVWDSRSARCISKRKH